VPRLKPSISTGKAAVLALTLACAACVSTAPRVSDPGLPAVDEGEADPAPWWSKAGDPVLAQVIGQGLAHDAALVCSAWQLQGDAARMDAHRRHLGGRLASLMKKPAVPQGPAAGAYSHADLVNSRAADMAGAYLGVRLAQARLAARRAAVAPWQDNTEIARFRREAGLVSAIDSSLGGVMVDLDADAVAQAQADVNQQIARLASQTGLAADALAALVGEGGGVPTLSDLAAQPPRRAALMALRQQQAQAVLDGRTSADDARVALDNARTASDQAIDRAAKTLAMARDRVEASARSLAQAERTVRDARSGYRAGAETFATLYVAEASALAAAEADAAARASLAQAQVQLWAAQGLGWTTADLALPTSAQAASPCPAQP